MQEDDSTARGVTDGSASEEESSSYVASSEAEDGSTTWSDVASETSSFEASSRKKRRKIEHVSPPPRPDNVQTRKLRPPQHLRQKKPEIPREQSASPDSSPEPVMVREIAQDEIDRNLIAVRGMWEMATVFHFFQAFQDRLQLTTEMPKMDEIEHAIVKSNGYGLLARLHTDLLKGFKPRLGADESNWQSVLARKLRTECTDPKENPFNPERGNEVKAYCNAPAENRVRALKLLCDFRCCENDVREVFDFYLKPWPKDVPRRKKTKKDPNVIFVLRKSPIGQVNAVTLYWYLEAMNEVDFRLYKETREHVRRREQGRLRLRSRVKSWELVASTVEQLIQFGEELPIIGTHSRNLKKKVLEEVVPRLEKQIEREERRLKAIERMRQHECNIILDNNGGYGRSARTRNDAKYTFEEYERAMAEAIDEGMVWSDNEDGNAVEEEIDSGHDLHYVHDTISLMEETSVQGETDRQDRDNSFPDSTTAFNAAADDHDNQL